METVSQALAKDGDLPLALRGHVQVRSVEHRLSDLVGVENRLAAYLSSHELASNGTTVDVIGNDVDLRAGPASVAKLREHLASIQRLRSS